MSELVVSGFTLSPCGLIASGDIAIADWGEAGQYLRRCTGSVMWWLGDWVLTGERFSDEQRFGVFQQLGWSPNQNSCRKAAYVASRFGIDRRRSNLSWEHHCEVAGTDIATQDALLDEAERDGLSKAKLRARVRQAKLQSKPSDFQGCTIEDLLALAASGRKFGTIYADPPWQYGNQATRASTDNHYQTMAVEEIAALPVAELAAEPSHLHLWTTNAFLADALGLIGHWGFEFKSAFIWVKPQIGLGNYWRVAHEYLLLGVKGGRVFADGSLRSWAEYERDKHSAKPEQVRLSIEKASPGPYLELFARRANYGWTAWGNEIERDLIYLEINGAQQQE